MNQSQDSRDVLTPVPSSTLALHAVQSQAGRLMLQEPTPETPLPFGRYQLIRRIGAGGMGEVFLAREASPHPRACVLKKVLPNLVANRAFVGRFLDEAKVVVRLHHPNIARVYAMGDVNGEYYLTMEYVQGKTVSRFSRRLRDKRAEMPLGLALLIGEKVCEGLQYAHDAKDAGGERLHLVHRDLSPANVCISYQGDVKIIDFGAAQSTLKEEQTAPRVVIGNLTYMAPEQARKQIVDGRADVYSCGVMLWEMLAWHALPQKGDPIERWRKAANPVWERPSLHQASVPAELDDIVLKALKKDPKERYATASEFAEALRVARLKHAPGVSERDLGLLLSKMFPSEKAGEDSVLAEAIHGAPRSPPAVPHETSRRMQVVPPTALAFEHTAILAPEDFLPDYQAEPPEPNTDPNRPIVTQPAAEPPPPPVMEANEFHWAAGLKGNTRTSFGVTFSQAVEPGVDEPSLIEEIEAIDSGDPISDAWTSPFVPPRPWRKVALFGAVFCLATGLGFLGVWLSLR